MRRGIALLLLLLCLTGCKFGKNETILPKDILEFLLEKKKEYKVYYSESTIKYLRGEKVISESQIYEWYENKNGRERWRHDSVSSEYHSIVIAEQGKPTVTMTSRVQKPLEYTYIENNMSIEKWHKRTSKIEFEDFMTEYSFYNMSLLGNERLGTKETLRIRLEPKEKSSRDPIESIEIWVDDQSYLILKSVVNYSEVDREKFITEYKTLQELKKIDDEVFRPDVSDDIIIRRITDPRVQTDWIGLRSIFGIQLKRWPNTPGYQEKIYLRSYDPGTDEEMNFAEILYSDANGELFKINLNKSAESGDLFKENGFKIGNSYALYLEENNSLILSDREIDYFITSSDVRIGKAEIIKIAEDLMGVKKDETGNHRYQ